MDRIKVDKIPLSVHYPTDGKALRYHVDDFMTHWIPRLAEDLCSHEYITIAKGYVNERLLRLYLEQALYIQLLGVGRTLLRRRSLREVNGIQKTHGIGCPPELYDLVRRNWPDDTIAVRKGSNKRIRDILRAAKHRIRGVMVILYARTRSIERPRFKTPMVAVELVEGTDPHEKCDAFWLASKRVNNESVLFILERRNRIFLDIEKEYKTIKRLGCHVICLDPSLSLNGKIPLWYPRKIGGWVLEFKKKLRSHKELTGKWLRRTLENCANSVGYWEALALENNIVMFQQMTEYGLSAVTIRMAMDRVGGIELGKMRSQFFDLSSAAFHFQHEIAFVWHHNVARYLKEGNTQSKMIVECGYIYDNMIPRKKTKAKKLRAQVEGKGVTTVITIYDNDPHDNGHFNEHQLEAFYRVMIDVAKEYHCVGLIVKSKKPRILNEKLTHIKSLLEDISHSGRCVILQEQLTSIVPSALAADLVVGIPCSTAVCEAAIIGRRIVMYDPSGACDHILADARNVVFRDLDSLRAAINSYVECQEHSETGNISAYIDEIDRYRDGQSCERAAQFIELFLKTRLEGRDKQECLDAISNQLQQCIYLDSAKGKHNVRPGAFPD